MVLPGAATGPGRCRKTCRMSAGAWKCALHPHQPEHSSHGPEGKATQSQGKALVLPSETGNVPGWFSHTSTNPVAIWVTSIRVSALVKPP